MIANFWGFWGARWSKAAGLHSYRFIFGKGPLMPLFKTKGVGFGIPYLWPYIMTYQCFAAQAVHLKLSEK